MLSEYVSGAGIITRWKLYGNLTETIPCQRRPPLFRNIVSKKIDKRDNGAWDLFREAKFLKGCFL